MLTKQQFNTLKGKVLEGKERAAAKGFKKIIKRLHREVGAMQVKTNKKKRGKYYSHVEPNLFQVECWTRDGLSDKQVAKNLGIAYSTFRKYRDEHSALSAALKKGKEIVDFEVENALYKRAVGYDYEEVKTLIEEVDGKKKKKVEKTTKHVPADVSAGIFWLRNRKGHAWSNKEDLEKLKLQVEIDKMKAEIEEISDDGNASEDWITALQEVATRRKEQPK